MNVFAVFSLLFGFIIVALGLSLLAAVPLAFISMLIVGAIFPTLGWGFWYFYGISFLFGLIVNSLRKVR